MIWSELHVVTTILWHCVSGYCLPALHFLLTLIAAKKPGPDLTQSAMYLIHANLINKVWFLVIKTTVTISRNKPLPIPYHTNTFWGHSHVCNINLTREFNWLYIQKNRTHFNMSSRHSTRFRKYILNINNTAIENCKLSWHCFHNGWVFPHEHTVYPGLLQSVIPKAHPHIPQVITLKLGIWYLNWDPKAMMSRGPWSFLPSGPGVCDRE
jgi:hypothetical protein